MLRPLALAPCLAPIPNMKTEISWTFGNFDLTCVVAADVNGPAAERMLQFAATNILQRGPAGAAEKALAGYDKRPAGFQRNSIAYNEQRAAKLTELFTGKFNLNPDGEPEYALEYACTGVSEHIVGGSKQDLKYVEERKVCARHKDDYENFLVNKIGTGVSYEHGTYDNPTTEVLAAIRAYVKAMTAGV